MHVFCKPVRDVDERWRETARYAPEIRAMTREAMLLIRLRACGPTAASAGARLDIFHFEDCDLVDVHDENEALVRIRRRRAPVRSALIARHRDRIDHRGG